jgi:hypothetical protein
MTNIVTIDFSLNSSGICTYNIIEKKYEFFSIVNTPSFLGKKAQVLKDYTIHSELEKLEIVKFIKNERYSQDSSYGQDQKNKIEDAIKIANLILDLIPENTIVGMEGFAYSSQSRSFIDLILFASIVRSKIYEKLKDIKIISPSELKKFATGKGNANKVSMYQSFIKEKDDINNHDLFKYILENNVANEKIVEKPIDDLIDSYWLNKYINKIIKI